MIKKDSVITGLLIGLIVPYVGWAIWITLFEQLDFLGAATSVGLSESFRERTTALLAISTNILPFLYANRNKFFDMMRGIIFPTVMLSIAWLFYFNFI